MLAASIIGLALNTKITDFESYLDDRPLAPNNTRVPRGSELKLPSTASSVLIVDDSIHSGSSMQTIRDRLSDKIRVQKLTFCTIYASSQATHQVDLHLEILENPRSFEWNMLHRPMLSQCCVDIDGILCVDPTDEQNDDGGNYVSFLENATPLMLPTYPAGHLVTSRLEKYRRETEGWLKKHGVSYVSLHMLDLPDAHTRRTLGCHAEFKARIYRGLPDTVLFLESEPSQANEIARLAGKPVVCFKTQKLISPSVSYAMLSNKTQATGRSMIRRLQRLVNSIMRG